MGTAKSLLFVLTHPQDPAREAEFNEWYTENHIKDVLLVDDFLSANRFKKERALMGDASPYLGLYQVDSDDPEAAHAALMKHLTTPIPFRLPMPLASAGAQGGLLVNDGWGYFSKIGETGSPEPAGDHPPKAACVIFMHPEDPAMEKDLVAWYVGNHMIDVASSPHIRSGTFYKLAKLLDGEVPPYVAVYELEADNIDEVHQGLMNWMQTPSDFRQPTPKTPDGKNLQAIDFWGYFVLINSQVKTPLEELLRR